MKNLLWLASYPKSGNTWMRIFLANLQKGEAEPIDINEIGGTEASNREMFNHFSGLESTLLTDAETLYFRHQVYDLLDSTLEKLTVLKTHAIYLCNSDGERLFSSRASRGAIYLIRNPLDLAASWANYNSITLDESISFMANEAAVFAVNNGKPRELLAHPVSSWSRHVVSWTEECEIPLLVFRYEDLVFQPFESFSRAALFTKLSEDPLRIRQAIERSSFDILKEQEQSKGFREKPKKMGGNFFRKGKVGSWREELSPIQVERIIQDHGAVMRKFGYLTEDGTPVY